MTSNELRQIVGLRPSDDPNADVLRNKNLSQSNEEIAQQQEENPAQAYVNNIINQTRTTV